MNNKIPAYFLPHGGGPWPFMSDYKNDIGYNNLKRYLQSIKETLPQKPDFIIIISAHWEEEEFTITTKANPNLLYDYYGFPENTYNLNWKVNSDINKSKYISEILEKHGIKNRFDENRDFDHGVFVPLIVAFGDTDIPIIQISLKKGLDPKSHIDLGKSLSKLREEGVLILGSGMNYHNMRGFFNGIGYKDSVLFNKNLETIISKEKDDRNSDFINWKNIEKSIDCHPREEHLIPLMVISGTGGEDIGVVDFRGDILGVEIISVKF